MDEKTALRQMDELRKNSLNMRLAAEKWASDFQTLIAIILSARTLDETTIKVCTELFKTYSTAESLSKASSQEIEKKISLINFYQNKSRYIVECAEKLVELYKGNVPYNIDKLIELPGVGRKTANVFLSQVGKDGLGVDTHVQYISKRLGWTLQSKPEKIEEDLKNLFSRENWNKVNETLVRFGKTHTSRKNKDEILAKIKRIK
jgi:endonuclease-3